MDCFDRQAIGKEAEQKACQFLQSQGLVLLQKNFFCRLGEIDLIMQDQEDIVFVEVRSRKNTDYGNALESINRSKIKKLLNTATYFLQKKMWLHVMNSRFDVIAINPVNGSMKLEWFKNVFSAEA